MKYPSHHTVPCSTLHCTVPLVYPSVICSTLTRLDYVLVRLPHKFNARTLSSTITSSHLPNTGVLALHGGMDEVYRYTYIHMLHTGLYRTVPQCSGTARLTLHTTFPVSSTSHQGHPSITHSHSSTWFTYLARQVSSTILMKITPYHRPKYILYYLLLLLSQRPNCISPTTEPVTISQFHNLA